MDGADSVVTIDVEQLGALLAELKRAGRRLIGPTVREGAIVYAQIDGIGDLPRGVTEIAEPGRYRLVPRTDGALFGWSVGPESFKRHFFEPTVRLWRARRRDGSFEILGHQPESPTVALIGARACDLAAIAVQDRVFMSSDNAELCDESYSARRRSVFVLAVSCGHAGGTCFCASMGTGPRVDRGHDLALTELLDEGGHRFVVEVGSPAGEALLARLSPSAAPSTTEDIARADATVAATRAAMGRHLDTTGIRELLARNLDHPRWDEVATRCLSCTNCTLVCPTCYCSAVEDTTSLDGETAERTRQWDSCFTRSHSYVHGGSVRGSIKARYRQWLTHKLGTWIDQFGTSGCVGCGRCIAWCPVGIDITEEVAAIRATEGGQ